MTNLRRRLERLEAVASSRSEDGRHVIVIPWGAPDDWQPAGGWPRDHGCLIVREIPAQIWPEAVRKQQEELRRLDTAKLVAAYLAEQQ